MKKWRALDQWASLVSNYWRALWVSQALDLPPRNTMQIAKWRRMVTEFFLREINAHRCMRFNLSRGSTSAMRRLRQEAGDLEEAPAADIIWITCHDDFLIGGHYVDHLPDAGYTRDVNLFWQSGPRKA